MKIKIERLIFILLIYLIGLLAFLEIKKNSIIELDYTEQCKEYRQAQKENPPIKNEEGIYFRIFNIEMEKICYKQEAINYYKLQHEIKQ